MKKRILALLLCLALVFSLFGCTQEPAATESPTTPTTEPPPSEPAPADVYAQAAEALRTAQDIKLTISTETTSTVGLETYTLLSEQTLTYTGLGTDAMQASLSEELDMGGYTDSIDEIYADGILYVTVYDEYKFKGEMTAEDFTARFAPAVALDEALYGSIISQAAENGIHLTFSAPTDAESWALPEGAEFISAEGSATINADGTLAGTTYTIDYTSGAAQVSTTVTVVPEILSSVELTVPASDEAYVQTASIEAIRPLELAVLYVCNTGTVSSVTTETIISQAAGYMHTEQFTVNSYSSGSDYASDVKYTVNAYQGYDSSTYTQQEHFENGIYTIASDGGDPEVVPSVSANSMLYYCQDYLTENLLSLNYIAALEATEVGGILYLDITGNDAMGDAMNAYICSNLWNDENFLNDLASAYVTNECTSYLALDRYTGLPTATGIAYSGTHTIDGADYALSLQVDQSFHLASLSVYEAITEETLPEEEPETKATPLFYHVTGENGQEMWLMGTIHVGDERTAFLPQEIYDALDASDALAVEFDTDAFDEQLETDTELLTQLSAAYFYSDGSATKDHLEEDIYEAAVMLLKASGNYSLNAEYMKSYLWSQSIENFYLQQGYTLLSDKGMDSRLLKLAREKGMEIRDIESGLFQLQMLTGFSDDLQAILLEGSLSTDSAEYNADVWDLYEKWCAGDEAVLREELSDEVDTSELTEEELAEYEAQKDLYDEYNKAMSYDRNDGMLKAAIDYLESGEVVFYAVGLAHLLNDTNGLVDTLREAGYTVELVQYAE